jgi:hypothetical protein
MLRSELITRATVANVNPASRVPDKRYHLLQVPPKGGNPIILKEAMKNAVIVIGIWRPIPYISLISVLCRETIMAPAQKNKVIFPNACKAMWRLAPTIPSPLAREAPRIIYASCPIVE